MNFKEIKLWNVFNAQQKEKISLVLQFQYFWRDCESHSDSLNPAIQLNNM